MPTKPVSISYLTSIPRVRVWLSIPPEEVAKTIFQAISNDKPEFRYVVGNYAASLLETRNNTPYSEFQKMIIQNIMQ